MWIDIDISWIYALVLFKAYLLGSIPFGVILAPLFGVEDIRNQGSGNIGATNALRVGGKKLGATIFVLDALKGVLAVLLTMWFAGEYQPNVPLVPLAALCAVVGHVFPIWLGFKGGKGVATSIAVSWTIFWPVGLLTTLTWLSVFWWRRTSSLAALAAMVIKPALAFYFVERLGMETVYICMVISLLVIIRHKENIQRMISREEGTL